MIKIGKPFTPSTIVKSKELKMTEIMISCGGGMGGSRWEVYTQDEFDLNERFITVDTNRNKSTVINTNFVVQVRPVRIFKVTIKNDGNHGVGQAVGTTEDYYYLIPEGEKVALTDEYTDDPAEKIKFHK